MTESWEYIATRGCWQRTLKAGDKVLQVREFDQMPWEAVPPVDWTMARALLVERMHLWARRLVWENPTEARIRMYDWWRIRWLAVPNRLVAAL